jgi:hypothetical protein
MTTAFAGIVGAIVTSLTATTPVSDNIFRARMRPIAAQHSTAVVVRLIQATPSRGPINGAPVDWLVSVAVECYARSATTTPDLAVDALVQAVYARLMADITLAGASSDLVCIQAGYDFDADVDQTACATLTFQARCRTAELALT